MSIGNEGFEIDQVFGNTILEILRLIQKTILTLKEFSTESIQKSCPMHKTFSWRIQLFPELIQENLPNSVKFI